jgi:hypothetical protein
MNPIKYMKWFLALYTLITVTFALRRPLIKNLYNKRFIIGTREIKKEINQYDNEHFPTSGFYGLIGPDVDKLSINNLYDLLTGDGVVQGVFFDNETITFVNHFVRTDKLVYEEKYGRFSKNHFMMMLYMVMTKLNIIPNIMGLANTALLPIDDRIYALFEQDLPYELKLDFEKKEIRTIEKKKIKGIKHFSGHSKNIDNTIHTLDYDPVYRTATYIVLDNYFNVLKRISTKTKHLPIIHDFHVLKNGFLFIDSPFSIDVLRKVPVVFGNKPTYIHIVNGFSRTCYECENPFYLFHYADVKENEKTYEILGSQYDSINFANLKIHGKYRKIIINKKSKKVFILKNRVLEKMNLDFPIKWGEYVVLRCIENNNITGFVVCRGLDIVNDKKMPTNRYVYGEPVIITKSCSPYLIGFAYDSMGNNYLFSYHLFEDTYNEVSISPDINLSIGFHSVFIP